MRKLNMLILLMIIFTLHSYSDTGEKSEVLVNGEKITEAEINYELCQIERQAMIAGEQQQTPLNYANMEELRKTVIDTLIYKKLLLQECEKREITIEPERIETNFSVFAEQFPTRQQFYSFLNDSGISEEKLREEINTALRIDSLAQNELEKRGGTGGRFSEDFKQKALAELIEELLQTAIIEYY